MNEEQLYYAWRTHEGESYIRKEVKIDSKMKPNMHWYRCADFGMENELVLCHSIYKKNNDMGLKFTDKFIQKVTGSGKKCSGLVSKWVRIANPDEYDENGTFIKL